MVTTQLCCAWHWRLREAPENYTVFSLSCKKLKMAEENTESNSAGIAPQQRASKTFYMRFLWRRRWMQYFLSQTLIWIYTD